MAFLLDLTDASGKVTRDVYARLRRSQRALMLTVDVFAEGEPISPAGSSRGATQIAERDQVSIARHGQVELIYSLTGHRLGGDIISLPDSAPLAAALEAAATGDSDATIAALYAAVRHRLEADPVLTGKISNVRDA